MRVTVPCSIAALLAAACGGTSPASSTTASNAGGADATFPPPRELPLFTEGASWPLATEQTVSMYAPDEPGAGPDGMTRQVDQGQARCTVVAARPITGGVVSRIECDATLALGAGEPLAGAWAATDAGVWRLAEYPEAGDPALDPAEAWVAAGATPRRVEEVVDPEMEHVDVIALSHTGAMECFDGSLAPAAWEAACVAPGSSTWCVGTLSAAGDEAWTVLCLDADGPVSGRGGFAGGSVQELVFTRTAD